MLNIIMVLSRKVNIQCRIEAVKNNLKIAIRPFKKQFGFIVYIFRHAVPVIVKFQYPAILRINGLVNRQESMDKKR
jgi:hypothetical protein